MSLVSGEDETPEFLVQVRELWETNDLSDDYGVGPFLECERWGGGCGEVGRE